MRTMRIAVMTLAVSVCACGRRSAGSAAPAPTLSPVPASESAAAAKPQRASCAAFAKERGHDSKLAAVAIKTHGHDADAYSDCIDLGYGIVGYYLAPSTSIGFAADVVLHLETATETAEQPVGQPFFNGVCPSGAGFTWCYRASGQKPDNVVLDDQRPTLRQYSFGFASGVQFVWPPKYRGPRADVTLYLARADGYLGPFARFDGIVNRPRLEVTDADHDGKLDVVVGFEGADITYLGHNTGVAFDFTDAAAKAFVERECTDFGAPFVATAARPCPGSLEYGCGLVRHRAPSIDDKCFAPASADAAGPLANEPKVALTTLAAP